MDTSNHQDSVIQIIFDEAHMDPSIEDSVYRFNHEDAMQKSLDILSQLDFNGDFKADFNISINKDFFNESYFEKIGSNGILIITLLDRFIGSSESFAIRTWVEKGGSIFIATQPDYAGFKYCKVHETNLFLKKLRIYEMFHLYEFQDNYGNYNSDELYDDNLSHQFTIGGEPTNSWDIVVTNEQFTNNEFGQAMVEGIRNVLIGTSSIEVNSSEYVGAFSWTESYSVSDITGEMRLKEEAIPWLAGTNLGKGRVVLLGSTFPVSDWTIYGTTQSFIDQLDNMRLWVNIINWLSQDSEIQTTTTNSRITTLPQPTPLSLTTVLLSIIITSIMTIRYKKKRDKLLRWFY